MLFVHLASWESYLNSLLWLFFIYTMTASVYWTLFYEASGFGRRASEATLGEGPEDGPPSAASTRESTNVYFTIFYTYIKKKKKISASKNLIITGQYRSVIVFLIQDSVILESFLDIPYMVWLLLIPWSGSNRASKSDLLPTFLAWKARNGL